MQTEYFADHFCAIVAVNDEAILQGCLRQSPDIKQGRLPLTVITDASSMPQAYNSGLSQTNRPICVLVHQDVYLPKGWLDRAIDALCALSSEEPNWMVAGSYGVRENGTHIGRVWDANMQQELGEAGFAPERVGSLDELLIILRRPETFAFDEGLPSFHLYGTDLVQTAKAMGRASFAVELPVVHNNRPWHSLGGGYLEAYRYTRSKWREHLPIHTTVCTLSRNPLPLLRARFRRRHVGDREKYALGDARQIARDAGYESA